MIREKSFTIKKIKQAQGGEYVDFVAKVLPFDEVDLVGDYATEETEGQLRTQPLPLLFNHDPEKVIGIVTALTKKDDGFYIDGKIKRKFVSPELQDVSDAIVEGLLRGVSGGFYIEDATRTDTGLHYDKFTLYEVSIVTVPSFNTYQLEMKSKNMHNHKQKQMEEIALMLEQFASEVKVELARLQEQIQFLIDAYTRSQTPEEMQNDQEVQEAQAEARRIADKYKKVAEDFLKRVESIKLNL